MTYFHSKVDSISIWADPGTRAQFSPDGKYVIHDYKNPVDQMYDIRLVRMDDTSKYIELTAGRSGLPQRNNGNGVFHPLWPQVPIVVFISEAPLPHYLGHIPVMGDPGVGLFCNLWALNVASGRVTKLTNYPIKMDALDGITVQGVVFPRFMSDGSKLLWTERYSDGGGYATPSWGKWGLRWADFDVNYFGRPRLSVGGVGSGASKTGSGVGGEVVYRPFDSTGGVGNYIVCTAGFYPGSDVLVVASNKDGQHEFNMDIYLADISQMLASGGVSGLTNLMALWGPGSWEEGSAICPVAVAGGGFGGGVGHKIMYMSSITNPHPVDYNIDWVGQERQNEWWIMNADGSNKQRVTAFNDNQWDDFVRPYGRAHPAAMTFSPDGKTVLGILGSKHEAPYPEEATNHLRIVKIDLKELF